MNDLFGIIFMYLLSVLLAIPLGKYIAKVYKEEKTLLDFFTPVENWIFKMCSIDPNRSMNWKQNLFALLTINMIWFVWAMIILVVQGSLFLNPDGNPSQTSDLAFNTAISFVVNCNLQHYSGESGLTYLSQLLVITFLQFVSAATGMTALAILFRGLVNKTTNDLGNFWNFFLKTNTRILLPLSFVVATVLVFNGTPASFKGKDEIETLQGDKVQVSRGPAAGMIAIKHLGTNGGGWFGANSAHPFENPNYLTNITEMVAQVLIPVAMIFALGFFIKRKKLSVMIFGVMTVGFLLLVIPTIYYELQGNPKIAQMELDQSLGNMEGKEIRFGSAASAYWSVVTTTISAGSVNAMQDSLTPMGGLMSFLGMMVNAFYGGVGVGLLNYYIYIIIAVFISGLMVGRTPELLGRKIEAKEIKIAVIVQLLSPLLILSFTAVACYIINVYSDAEWSVKPPNWLNNQGFHGFSEMLYEYVSANANNGSGFEGLKDNNIWWNLTTGFIMILGRYIPIIGPIAIAGILANKKYIPESVATLKAESLAFSIMTFAVIVILTALTYFPVLALGPLAESFSIK